jgi:hypothetical protein
MKFISLPVFILAMQIKVERKMLKGRIISMTLGMLKNIYPKAICGYISPLAAISRKSMLLRKKKAKNSTENITKKVCKKLLIIYLDIMLNILICLW